MAFPDLDPHIDNIFDAITEGATIRELATNYNTSKTRMQRFISGHPARANEAYRTSAQSMAEKAIEVLMDDNIDIMRGRELASHYRWEAKMRDRAKYGDKVEVDNKPPVFTQDNFNQLLEIARNNAIIPGSSE